MLFVRRPTRAYRTPLAVLVVFVLILFLWLSTSRGERRLERDLVLSKGLYGISESATSGGRVSRVCRAHGFAPYNSHRKVYDLFLFSTELDMLEIRLQTLAPFVDFFVIVESNKTFTGLQKPLRLLANWEQFTVYHPKIIYRIIGDPGPSLGSRTWDHEDYMRNALLDKVFPGLVGSVQAANDGDVLIVSDIDELPKPATVELLRHCQFPARLTLRSHLYYYSFQWLHRGEQWPHPQATVYRSSAHTISPKDLRNGEGSHGWFFLGDLRTWWEKAELWDAAWHCSSCFSTLHDMRAKMESFSHTPWNTAANRETKNILERVRYGLDLFDRPGEMYDRVEGNTDVPQYVLENRERFGYLLDRDEENAGFADVDIEDN